MCVCLFCCLFVCVCCFFFVFVLVFKVCVSACVSVCFVVCLFVFVVSFFVFVLVFVCVFVCVCVCMYVRLSGLVSFHAHGRRRGGGRRRLSSWLKEYAFMKALHEHGFPTPVPIDSNRHVILMSVVDGFPMCVVVVVCVCVCVLCRRTHPCHVTTIMFAWAGRR